MRLNRLKRLLAVLCVLLPACGVIILCACTVGVLDFVMLIWRIAGMA